MKGLVNSGRLLSKKKKKKNSKVTLNPLIILAKVLVQTVSVQMDITYLLRFNWIILLGSNERWHHFNQLAPFEIYVILLSKHKSAISRTMKSIYRWRSQKYLFRRFRIKNYGDLCSRNYFKSRAFSIFFRISLRECTNEVWKLSFERYLILDIQPVLRNSLKLQKPHYENFRSKYINNENCRSCLGN